MNAQTLSNDKQNRVVNTLPFVEALARRMAASMPHSIDIGDLVQDGVMGLTSTPPTASTRAGASSSRPSPSAASAGP